MGLNARQLRKRRPKHYTPLRWARCNTKKGHIKTEDVLTEANIEPMTTFLRKRRLRWYCHVLRKEGEVTPRRC